ncbi:MAG: Pycsar system effector family protein [Bacteroidota bacterium]
MKQQDPNNYWEQLERLEKLKSSSELKAGVVFSFHSVIIGIFIDNIGYFQSILSESIFLIILVFLWILLVLISIFYSFKCFMPRMELKFKKNVFFFRNAANSFGNIDEYTEELTKTYSDDEKLYKKLSQQIFIESKIIDQKFKSVQKSITYFVLSFMLLVLILGLFLIIKL